MRRIGIDVGGTSTDAVVVDGTAVVASTKVATTPDVLTGVEAALDGIAPALRTLPVDAVMFGTTQFTNAVVERRRLARVAAIRVGLPAAASLPPMVDWPADLREAIAPMTFLVTGGHEYDGRPIAPLDRAGVRRAAEQIAASGIRAVAVSAVFSPLTAEAEDEAATLVREVIPDADVTLSGSLGRLGLLERENVAVLNACLVPLARLVVGAFEEALRRRGLDVPVYLTQNDGTVVLAAAAAANPVFCFASGPTNSMRGAALLSGLDEAIVVDVGGTTSDIGAIRLGFPRQANNVVEVGGVRTLFRMPDLLSLALGGGSLVEPATGAIGPGSVGYRVTDDALVFGGSTLTATDVAVAAGRVDLGDRALVRHLPRRLVDDVLARSRAMIEVAVDRMKESAGAVELVAVGGGAFLVPDDVEGVAHVHAVEHATVANAVGAAMAQVSGEVDQIFSGVSRAAAIDDATAKAVDRAVAAGAARGSVTVVEAEDLPLSYLPGDARRVRVRVIGDIAAVATVS